MNARALNVIGLMNIQFAIQNGTVYVLEVNPRASRTVPFVSKATGVPIAKIAAKVMTGRKLRDLGVLSERVPKYYSVKEAVFPFARFPGVDLILGRDAAVDGRDAAIRGDREKGVDAIGSHSRRTRLGGPRQTESDDEPGGAMHERAAANVHHS